MSTKDGRFTITFNGEIYNYQHLRSSLQKKGYDFFTKSDTEVLLHLYQDKGSDMLTDLRGMYAFAIWDDQKSELFLARDPFGIKPLYYADNGSLFRAASQVKALLAGGCISMNPDPAGHTGFFLWGHVPEPYTLFKQIRSLPAGSSMKINSEGKREVKTFCRIRDELTKASSNSGLLDRRLTIHYLRDALLDSIKYHLIADVPVGIFLSSGLDSTTLTALCSEFNEKIQTITLGFEEYRGTVNDETPLAEAISKRYGTKHRTVWVKQTDFKKDLSRILHSMDQPTIDGVNSYYVSKAAAQSGLKVAISGLGGDELFGSYPSFKQIPKIVDLMNFLNIPSSIAQKTRKTFYPVIKKIASPKYAGLFEFGHTFDFA